MPAPITPRQEKVVFYQGDDEAELRRLNAVVKQAEKNGSEDEVAEANTAAADFATEAEGRGVSVVLRSVGRKTWNRLVAENPPREGDKDDEQLRANADTFPEALVPVCIGSMVVAGESVLSDEDRESVLDSLSTAQWDRLSVTAWLLNTSVGADPKARPASATIPN